ncbi:C-type mannose receptor 2-like isoform X2 [Spodoptera litura]|uniref:C-type mannose receptor 2-like isoform X2 n=1 Tax=Spodoptera litura TaxID=69820 RepID=A0A9J7DVV9_SPOLT|nr:C-type mannose receptor 2-like isoform X2 [Spodoptera litura]
MASKTLLVLLILYVITETSGQEIAFRSDYTYIAEQETFYKIHLTPLSWLEAKRICALEDAILFHPENVVESEAVFSFMKNATPWIHEIYVSLNDIDVEGMFQTIDGKLISDVYFNWRANEPNNSGGNEDCVAMLDDGKMNDNDCSYKKYFVCKKPLHSVIWNSRCNMSSPDYTYSEQTGSCYKLHTKPVDWLEAFDTCRREQSNLAVINSQSEMNVLVNLTIYAPALVISKAYQKGIFHLGFENRYNNGWVTVEGMPMETQNATWWGGYYPGDECHNKCGGMFYNGYLVNNDCGMKSLFICEHKVNNQEADKLDGNVNSHQLW